MRTNDFAGLLEATVAEQNRAGSSSPIDPTETPQTVAEKIADLLVSDDEAQFLGLWTTLAGPDGVARAERRVVPALAGPGAADARRRADGPGGDGCLDRREHLDDRAGSRHR